MPYNINGEPMEERMPWWVLVVIAASIVVALGLVWVTQPVTEKKQQLRHDSLEATLTNDGTYIRWYVFVDPDTGAEYLVNDRGGCTPRLDKDGTPILILNG